MPTASNRIQAEYPQEYSILLQLYGRDAVQSMSNRLYEIHEFTEKKWSNYVKLIPGRQVKYLLIAEAPPWSKSGRPKYLFDEESESRSLLRALENAFWGRVLPGRLPQKDKILTLARHGFLMVDTLPFSMDYSKKRSTVNYKRLVQVAALGYFQNKISSTMLTWAPNVKIAFSLRRNASVLISVLNGKITIGSNALPIGEHQIAVNEAGYPCAKKLKKVFELFNNTPATTAR